MMQQIIDFLLNKEYTKDIDGYKLIGFLVLQNMYHSLKSEHHGFFNNINQGKCRSALNSLIFSKQFNLTPSTRKEYGPGQVFQVMRCDAAWVIDYTWNFWHHFMMPINLVQCVYWLSKILGISFVGGLFVGFLGTYVNTKINGIISHYNHKRNEHNGKRYN